MNTVGNLLKTAREKRNISLYLLSKNTKIKKVFLEAIENMDWEKLPEFPIALGFVKNVSERLGIAPETACAFLRRDYPPRKLKITPEPDIEKKTFWSPKTTFFAGSFFFLLILLGYLGFQYFKFKSSPKLLIKIPKENAIILKPEVEILGETDTDAKLEINNQPFIVDSEGRFEGSIEITNSTEEIFFKSISRSGKVSEKIVKIKSEFD